MAPYHESGLQSASMKTAVRRSIVLSLLVPMLLWAGFVLALNGLLKGSVREGMLGFLSSTFVFLGSAAALFSISRLKSEMGRLTGQIQAMVQTRAPRTLHAEQIELKPMAQRLNHLLDWTRQQVDDATLRAKELEIQLNIANAQRQHAQAIIYSISDAVLVTDPFDELVLANEAAARLFAFDLNDATRLPVQRVLKDDKVIQYLRDTRQSNSKRGRRIVEHKVRSTINGRAEERIFKITLSCVDDRSDSPAGVVMVLHDMTREKEIAQMKNDFVSSVSHELRTPLASIRAYVEMLIDGEATDDKAKREFYEVIQNESNRLSRLIDNILCISRIESGLVQIKKEPQSLTVILKEALGVIAPQARNRKITVEEELTPVFFQTLADKDMLYQAVLNLLSNAVKYTPEGGAIAVRTVVDEARKTVNTRIIDTGVGIPAKDLPYVFDKFYRSDANNHMAKGTGLGLSLVKHIIETVHRGRMFVESHTGVGSCFGFELDLVA